MDPIYVHDVAFHPLSDPRTILPQLLQALSPSSIVDVGCGIGTFLHVAKELGVKNVLGLDGEWVDKSLLCQHIDLSEFRQVDLTESITPPDRADFALCLEVAEHLPIDHAESLVELLTSISDVILFSAAIPGQGGFRHINEQWPGYWADLFKKQKFVFVDVVRPLIWDMESVSFWYKQNSFLVVHESCLDTILEKFQNCWPSKNGAPLALVHPELFTQKTQSHETFENLVFCGKFKTRSYLYLAAKSLLPK